MTERFITYDNSTASQITANVIADMPGVLTCMLTVQGNIALCTQGRVILELTQDGAKNTGEMLIHAAKLAR